MERKALMCATCKTTPFAYLTEGGVLVITSRHHGEKHTNTMTLEELEKAIAEFKAELSQETTVVIS